MTEPRRLPSADALELRQRLETAEWLNGIARHIAGDEYLDGPMTRALVVMWGPAGPKVTWHGRFYEKDLVRDTQRVIRAAIDPEQEARRVEWEVQQAAANDAYLANHPFVCSEPGAWCDRRYATERGLAGHLRNVARQNARCSDWSHGCGSHPCGKLGADLRKPEPEKPAMRPVAVDLLDEAVRK